MKPTKSTQRVQTCVKDFHVLFLAVCSNCNSKLPDDDDDDDDVLRAALSSMPAGRSSTIASTGPSLSSNTYGSSIWGAGRGSVQGMYAPQEFQQISDIAK